MRRLLCLVLAAVSANAAAIQGVVLDHYSGRPLARSVVTLDVIEANGVTRLAVRTSGDGRFFFSPLNAGAYLLTAERPNYATLKYGQKFWNAPAAPIRLFDETALFLDLRMHHLGAITGIVWDENEIGIAEQEVHVYRPAKPPVLLGRAKTDDRGVYRIGGLLPGSYLIRAGAKQLDDSTGVLPTFYKESLKVEEAKSISVELDQQVQEIQVRPTFGKLVSLSGRAWIVPACPTLTVTLISDMERKTVTGTPFSFEHLPRGDYELLAECDIPRNPTAFYQRFSIDRDTDGLNLNLAPMPVIQLSIEGADGKAIDTRSVRVLARRKDLAGEGAPLQLKDGMTLVPGRWELTVPPAGSLYPVSISGGGPENPERRRPDAWNEFLITRGRAALKITMASGAGSVHGRVTQSLNEPAVGAPVYLEAYDPDSNQRLVDLRRTVTSARGEYRFVGLTPGAYRIVSSFEFEDPDEQMMEFTRATRIALRPASEAVQDLDLYTRP